MNNNERADRINELSVQGSIYGLAAEEHNELQALISQEKAQALKVIADLIATTNNGKLMTINIPYWERKLVPELVADGWLRYARFIEHRDSVMMDSIGVTSL